MRDCKKFTSKKIIETIKAIPENRREWMLDRFEFAGRFDKRMTYKFWLEGTRTNGKCFKNDTSGYDARTTAFTINKAFLLKSQNQSIFDYEI